MTRRLRLIASVLSIFATTALSGCALNPATGDHDFVLMSERQEIELGRQSDPKVREEYGVYNNSALQAYIQHVGTQIAKHSHRPNIEYHFTVLDSSEVNAFALPGGYIYITRGILSYLSSEAELAAVLGHETGHVTARHAVRQYTAATATGLAVSILGGGQAGQQVLGVLGNAILSGYGRDHELQADHLGAEYIARTGYDPQAMMGVMTVLKNQEEAEKKRAAAEGREPQIYHGVFASHPSADKRLQEVVGEANEFKVAANPRVGREEYLKQIDGIVFGDSAREGVRRGSSFYHRDLDIGVNFPKGWRIANSPKAVIALAPDQSAMMQLSIDNLKQPVSPQEYLRSRLKTNSVRDEHPLEGSSLASQTAIANLNTPYGARDTRIIVLMRGKHAFTFFGVAKNDGALKQHDNAFLAAARSMHSLDARERTIAQGLKLHVVQARAGDTFASLAKRSPVSDYAELTLRLINNKFPNGEPAPGESIKIIE